MACALPRLRRLALAELALLSVASVLVLVPVTAAPIAPQAQLQGVQGATPWPYPPKSVESASSCNPTQACPDGDLCCNANTDTAVTPAASGICCAGRCFGDACCPYELPNPFPPLARLSLFAVDTPHCNILTVTNTSSTCFLKFWDAHGYQYNGTFCLGHCSPIYVLNELQGTSTNHADHCSTSS